MRTQAQTVIVGAGIVGCSAAAHLAAGGESDIVVVDRGPLFRTGGSTSHAPGLVFQNNASRTVSKLAQWTVETYLDVSAEGDPCYFPVTSLEVATTQARWADLHRKLGWAKSWGIGGATLLTPAEAKARLGLLDEDAILGAYYVPSDGTARQVWAAEAMARGATGATFLARTRVVGIEADRSRVTAVVSDEAPTAPMASVLSRGRSSSASRGRSPRSGR